MITQQAGYPVSDQEFEEVTVSSVKESGTGFQINREDGFSFFVPGDAPIEPKPGMTARFYGKGIGHTVRGLFLDGVKVYYRTSAEEDEKFGIETYGADAAEWLARWDAGKSVWSIEMGGIGPGYEQTIQILAAELVRHFIATDATWSDEDGSWKVVRDSCDPVINKVDDHLGFSGAQVGAAIGLAARIYRNGPISVMSDPAVKDRKILVSKSLPTYTPEAP